MNDHTILGTCKCGEKLEENVNKMPFVIVCKKCGRKSVLVYDPEEDTNVLLGADDRG